MYYVHICKVPMPPTSEIRGAEIFENWIPFGTGKISDDEILKLINDHFDFSVGNIIKELKLKDTSYQRLAEYGHFGNDIYPWENVDGKVNELKKATAKAST